LPYRSSRSVRTTWLRLALAPPSPGSIPPNGSGPRARGGCGPTMCLDSQSASNCRSSAAAHGLAKPPPRSRVRTLRCCSIAISHIPP
jgi:hypothetical protein